MVGEERWPEAATVSHLHGGRARAWVTERIVAPAMAGDAIGIAWRREVRARPRRLREPVTRA